jgi:hypothetical protein
MELGRFGQDPGKPEPETEEELLDLLHQMIDDFTDTDAQIIQFPGGRDADTQEDP